MQISRRSFLGAIGGASAASAAGTWIWGQRPPRPHGPATVKIEVRGDRRVITSNGLPDHPTGDFPNRHDPEPIAAQAHRVELPARPAPAQATTPLRFWWFGMAVNGVPFDPSGPSWRGDPASGWDFEVLCPAGAVALGIDPNHAHTQAGGMYHYHGLPTGLLWRLRREQPDARMLLVGWAADGFPVYGPEAPGAADDPGSPVRVLRSSYRLHRGTRPDGGAPQHDASEARGTDAESLDGRPFAPASPASGLPRTHHTGGPGGAFDGTFVQDFEHVPGHGDLDECNGRFGPTPEYPEGIYHDVLTDAFPFIPRRWRGTPDRSFAHGPPPGVSPPVPPELMRYAPIG